MVDSKELEKNWKLSLPTKLLLNQMISQMKQFQSVIGKKRTQDVVDNQEMPQEHRDYIYQKMGWL